MFKSGAKGLTGGSERIPVGCGEGEIKERIRGVSWRNAWESTIVEGVRLITWMGQRCGYGLILNNMVVERPLQFNLGILLSEQKDIDDFKEMRRSKVTKQMDGNA